MAVERLLTHNLSCNGLFEGGFQQQPGRGTWSSPSSPWPRRPGSCRSGTGWPAWWEGVVSSQQCCLRGSWLHANAQRLQSKVGQGCAFFTLLRIWFLAFCFSRSSSFRFFSASFSKRFSFCASVSFFSLLLRFLLFLLFFLPFFFSC